MILNRNTYPSDYTKRVQESLFHTASIKFGFDPAKDA